MIFLRIVCTLEDAGNNSLLIDDILTDEHCVVLQLIDIDEEFLTDIFTEADLLVVLSNLLRHELHHVGIEVDTVFQNTEESHMT